ncbi:Maf-like protein, putative [Eimeria tenella]|uniref:Maf-like protein, putative n=1 Tax=Eimeria tenella TaxID=5802 RepID=U6KM64_EIMTE|nr:Maf-like protein, putative [Eimeria tenella]CDJ39207.1 Maf-like protein, putative [Eimeria tenella]|eukprot:XP_013229962.1 Maf-like protein, putative [Eimeria tenella]
MITSRSSHHSSMTAENAEDHTTKGFAYQYPRPDEYPNLMRMATRQCSLLLASSSIFRRELFAKAAIPIGAFSVPLDEGDVQTWLEEKHPEVTADTRTLLIAHLKADAAIQALKMPDTQHLQELRLQNQILNVPEAERLPLLQEAERVARRSGRAAAAVAQLASFTKSCMALEAADGRLPVLMAVDTGIQFKGKILFKPKDKEEAASFLESYSEADAPIVVTTSVVLCDLVYELEAQSRNPNSPMPAKKELPHKCRACSKFQYTEPSDDPDPCTCPYTVVHAADILCSTGGPKSYHYHSREMFSCQSQVALSKMDKEARRRILEEGDVMYSAGALLIEKGEMAKHIKGISGCPHNVIGVPLGRVEEMLSLLIGRMESR